MAILHTHIPKRKKRKPTAKQRALQSSWEDIKAKYEPKKTIEAPTPKAPEPYRRTTAFVPSLGTHDGDCTKKEQMIYTGGNMLGIATLHKSNAVPVFSEEDAVEISRMRRG